MKRVDLLVSVVLFFLGAWVIWQSTMLPHFSVFGPGPEFAPELLAGTLMLLSAILFVTSARKAAVAGEKLMPDRAGITRIVIIIGAIFLYTYLIEILGYGLTTLIYCIGMMLAMWRVRWYYSLIVGALLTGTFYWAFVIVLDVPVPTGVFGM